jgi:hypothetical protein
MLELIIMKTSVKKVMVVITMLVLFTNGFAQKIKYTEIERDDSRQLNFDIIGKFNNNVIVYKNFRIENYFCVYDNDMKLVEKIKLTSLPNKLINVDFIAYPSYFYMIYQHQKKNIVYCEAIKFDNKGKKMEETQVLDTTSIPVFQNDNKIYQLLVSDDKQKIAIIKANKKNDRNHQFAAILFNTSLAQQYKRRFNIAMDGRNNYLDEFLIDNEGDIYMAKCYAPNGNEYVNKIDMLFLPAAKDTLLSYPINAKEKILDEIILKTDNINKRIIIQAFFYNKRRGNVDGLFVSFFEKNNPTTNVPNFVIFSDTLRTEAKQIGSSKMAFNDFFIRQVYPRKDGGFIMTAESYSTTVRGNGNPWNRYDYFGNTNYYTNYDYYNMGGRDWYWNSWDRFGNGQSVTYNAENVAIFSMSKEGSLEWSNVVHKDQSGDASEDFISYQVLLTGGQLHFLFNEKDRGDYLMYDNSITPAGQITRHPTLKNLNKQYGIMPRHGKQISAKEMVFPCTYKNLICFAKIEY